MGDARAMADIADLDVIADAVEAEIGLFDLEDAGDEAHPGDVELDPGVDLTGRRGGQLLVAVERVLRRAAAVLEAGYIAGVKRQPATTAISPSNTRT